MNDWTELPFVIHAFGRESYRPETNNERCRMWAFKFMGGGWHRENTYSKAELYSKQACDEANEGNV